MNGPDDYNAIEAKAPERDRMPQTHGFWNDAPPPDNQFKQIKFPVNRTLRGGISARLGKHCEGLNFRAAVSFGKFECRKDG